MPPYLAIVILLPLPTPTRVTVTTTGEPSPVNPGLNTRAAWRRAPRGRRPVASPVSDSRSIALSSDVVEQMTAAVRRAL